MPRRLAYFVDTEFFGGAEKLIVDLCAEALRRGDEPLLYHFGHRELAAQIDALGVRQRVLPGHAEYKSIRTVPRFARQLRAILREDRVGVLHSHLFGSVVAGALATAASGVKHVGTLHDSYTFDERPRLGHAVTAAGLLGTKVVAVSPSVRSAARRAPGAFLARVRVIENGVSVPPVPAEEDRLATRRELSIPPGRKLVCVVARLVPIKALDVLIEAWSRLAAEERGRLILVGDGPEREALEARARALGVSESIAFLGFRRDVSRLLFASDLFVLPSHSEGLSCSLLEAMAHGLAAVATDVGGNPELVAKGETGLLVPAGDPNALAEALRTVLPRDETLESMGRAARQRVLERFSQTVTFDRYWQLYFGASASS